MPRTLSPEHKKKLAAGKAKAQKAKEAARKRSARPRVKAYREWLAADRDYYAKPREDRKGKPPAMPDLPSKQDFLDVDGTVAPDELEVAS